VTINNAAQSFSLSLTYTYTFASESLMRANPAPSDALKPATTPPAVDSVTLSPESTAEAASGAAGTAPADGGAPPVTALPEVPAAVNQPEAPASRASRRADALLSTLDADKDGSITEQEFTEGALALLRRAGARHHHRHVHGDDHEGHGHHHGRAGRLERKLERLFDRLDADGNGGLGREELTAALSQVRRGSSEDRQPTPRAESPEPIA
jgi:hypothetical protein